MNEIYRNPFAPDEPTAVRPPEAAPALLNASPRDELVTVDSPPALAYPAPGATTVLISYRVPAGKVLVVYAMALVNVGTAIVDGAGNVLWHVLRNGAPLKGFATLYAQMGSLGLPQTVSGLVLGENETLTMTVSIPALGVAPGAGNNPAARLIGYLKLAGAVKNLFATVNPSAAAAAAAGGSASSGSGSASGGGASGGGGGGGGSSPGGGSGPRLVSTL